MVMKIYDHVRKEYLLFNEKYVGHFLNKIYLLLNLNITFVVKHSTRIFIKKNMLVIYLNKRKTNSVLSFQMTLTSLVEILILPLL